MGAQLLVGREYQLTQGILTGFAPHPHQPRWQDRQREGDKEQQHVAKHQAATNAPHKEATRARDLTRTEKLTRQARACLDVLHAPPSQTHCPGNRWAQTSRTKASNSSRVRLKEALKILFAPSAFPADAEVLLTCRPFAACVAQCIIDIPTL